jgi:monofunctional biosynthetic peptidoglycan transglycosylase
MARRPLRRRWVWRWLRRVVLALLLLFVVLPSALILAYRVLPVPATPLMIVRLVEGYGWTRDWTPLDDMSPMLPRAAIAAEDNNFCSHHGFDVVELDRAWEDYTSGRRVRGASTISMQVAKNLFLWEGRSLARKGIEAWFTVLLEALMPKRRIIEIYLNVAELGPGLYGAGAAAEASFGMPAADLTRRQAALLAATLPNPFDRSAAHPSSYVSRYAATIDRRIDALGGAYFGCLE